MSRVVYLILPVTADTEALAIAEAAETAKGCGNPSDVEVLRCNIERSIIAVVPDENSATGQKIISRKICFCLVRVVYCM